jgi:uncharacterized membrane protein
MTGSRAADACRLYLRTGLENYRAEVIVNVEVDIDRPREQVFDAMADARNEPTWNSQVSRTELLTPEPIGQGTQFTTVNRGQAYTATLTSYQRPDAMRFDVVGKTMTITGTLAFSEHSGRTRMSGAFDMQPRGFMKLMLPLMAGAVRKDFPRQMTRFKEFC